VSESLGLFPLGTTLLPGQLLPLHVFEPRYRDLLADLVSGTSSTTPGVTGRRGPRFGVVAIRSGHEVGARDLPELYAVGCVAELVEVQPHSDGTSDLVAVGRERFRLLGLDASAGTSYLTGVVQWLEEPLTPTPAALAAQVRKLFLRYRAALAGPDAGEAPVLPGDPTVLSWALAGSMVLQAGERQGLLEDPDAAQRLSHLRRLLRRELALLAAMPSLPATDLARQPPDPR
jgi:Lon protease-like protein